MNKYRIQYSGEKAYKEVERIASVVSAIILQKSDEMGAALLQGMNDSFSDLCDKEVKKSPFNGRGIVGMGIAPFDPDSNEIIIRCNSVETAILFKRWLCGSAEQDFYDVVDVDGELSRNEKTLDIDYHYPGGNVIKIDIL